MIEFSRRRGSAEILDPRENFSLNSIDVEFRRDPLTGESGRIAHIGLITPQKEDYTVWDREEYRQRCPFCPQNIDQATPMFPQELIPGGQIQKGEARVIANIGPYDQFSALTVMGKEHVMPLERMTASYLKDAFEASLEFCRTVLEKERELPYPMIAWNYMPPSGGGLLHPHQQIFVTDEPGNLYRKTMQESKNFYWKYGRNYWKELCRQEEEREERFISRGEHVSWLTSFTPLGVLGEILAVFPGYSTIYDITEEVLDDFLAGLLRVFEYFNSQNIGSFNMALFMAPQGEAEEYFTLHARLIPRTFINLQLCPPDMNSLQVALQESFSVISPEEQCRDLQSFFEG